MPFLSKRYKNVSESQRRRWHDGHDRTDHNYAFDQSDQSHDSSVSDHSYASAEREGFDMKQSVCFDW